MRGMLKLTVLEKEKDVLKIEVAGEGHTLLNALRDAAWKAGAHQATYVVSHPYLSNLQLVIRATYPKKVLTDACQLVLDDAKDFQKEFARAQKR